MKIRERAKTGYRKVDATLHGVKAAVHGELKKHAKTKEQFVHHAGHEQYHKVMQAHINALTNPNAESENQKTANAYNSGSGGYNL